MDSMGPFAFLLSRTAMPLVWMPVLTSTQLLLAPLWLDLRHVVGSAASA